MRTTINSIGILLSTIGSYLVWRYLTELNFVDKERYLQGEGVLVVPRVTPEDIKKFKRSLTLSKTGLALIAIGGALQIISNYID